MLGQSIIDVQLTGEYERGFYVIALVKLHSKRCFREKPHKPTFLWQTKTVKLTIQDTTGEYNVAIGTSLVLGIYIIGCGIVLLVTLSGLFPLEGDIRSYPFFSSLNIVHLKLLSIIH